VPDSGHAAATLGIMATFVFLKTNYHARLVPPEQLARWVVVRTKGIVCLVRLATPGTPALTVARARPVLPENTKPAPVPQRARTVSQENIPLPRVEVHVAGVIQNLKVYVALAVATH